MSVSLVLFHRRVHLCPVLHSTYVIYGICLYFSDFQSCLILITLIGSAAYGDKEQMENSKILRKKNSCFVHIRFKQNVDLLKCDHYLWLFIRKKAYLYHVLCFYDIQDRHLRPL